MPTYEYVCTSCKNGWEEIQKITADALEVCPKCGESTAKRQISGGNFILKGGGWYADLYSSTKKSGGGESSGDASSPTPSTSSESKSDSKPATAAPAAAAPAPAPAAPKADSGSK